MEKDSSGDCAARVFQTGDGHQIAPLDNGSRANSQTGEILVTPSELLHTTLKDSDLPFEAPTGGRRLSTRPSAKLSPTTCQTSSQCGQTSYFHDGSLSQLSDNVRKVNTRDLPEVSLLSSAETEPGTERKDWVNRCGCFSFQTANSSNDEIDVCPHNASSDGRDQRDIAIPVDSVGDRREDVSVSIDILPGPWDAHLQREPEEQIGPPSNNSSPASQTAGVTDTPGDTSCALGSGLSETAPAVALDVLDVSNTPRRVEQEDKAHLLRTESVSSSVEIPSCSKGFVQGSLRYKSKCRNYKFVLVTGCYLSMIVLVIIIKNLRPQTKDAETAENFEDFIDQLESREKRFAGRIHVESVPVHHNNSKCGPHFDENHNEIRIMSYQAFMSGGWIVHVIIGMYTFAAIAAICDIYFVPSLEHICEDLKLEADVAGATFMAAASSAPEFCTSVIGIFVQENDVGLSAIVGSSIFNLLAIVGLCAIFAGAPVELSWYPLTRDSIFYTVAIFEMLAFMYDTKIHWYEAVVMIMTYALYILVMVYNSKIERLANATETAPASRSSSFMHDIHRTQSARLEIIRARSHSRCSGTHLHMKHLSVAHSETGMNVNSGIPSNSSHESQMTQGPQVVLGSSADPRKIAHVSEEVSVAERTPSTPHIVDDSDESAVAEYENPLDFPQGWLHRVYWLVVFPVTLLHAYTIPDSRIQDSWQSRFYMIPFALSVLYLAIYSYIMVWAMSVAAWALDIPVTVTGLTILAAGTSVPDCLSSIFVARDGYGDMAVSNAIGSNVFDILLCLGIPWLVTSILEFGHSISSEGMWVAGSMLVITIVYLIVSLRICNWTLTPTYGYLTLFAYAVIIAFCILVELNVIFNLSSSGC